jgi:hypothetical protein
MSDIITAIKIQEATKESLHDPMVMLTAQMLVQEITGSDEMPSDEIIRALFRYSSLLSANVATRITSILMTESQFSSMCDEIEEFDKIGKEVLGE